MTPVRAVTGRAATAATAAVVAGALLLAAAPADASAAAGAGASPGTAAVRAVVPPASVPDVPAGVAGAARAVPGWATLGPGSWSTGSPVGFPAQRTEVSVPGEGMPLWADWDGDGLATPGRYASGTWSRAAQRIGPATLVPAPTGYGGRAVDVPLAGDWDGDGRVDRGVFRDGVFRWLTARGRTSAVAFGAAGDRPVVGDWNGDRRLDLGVVRGTTWLLRIAAGTALPPGLPAEATVRPAAAVSPRAWTGRPGTGYRVPVFAAPTGPVSAPAVPESPDAPTAAAGPAAADAVPADAAAADAGVATAPAPSAGARGAALPRRVTTSATSARARTVSFSLGRGTDVPVVGDWDGDGTTTPGVVRDRAQWRLVPTWARLRAPVLASFPAPAGTDGKPLPDAVPVVVPSPRDAAPGRCLTAAPPRGRTRANDVSRVVAPVALSRITTPAPAAADGAANGWDLARAALRDQVRYLVRSDLGSRLGRQRGAGYLDALATDRRYTEYAVRRPANSALAAVVAAATGALELSSVPGDPAAPAPVVARSTVEAYADWVVRSEACQHRAVTPGGWGRSWQSAMWAATLGTAAWYRWSRLPAQVRGYVVAMLVDEADAVTSRSITYWKDRSGAFLSGAGDSQAESVAWDGLVVALASSMMPTHPRAAAWRAAALQRAVAAFAKPSDLADTTPVNGIVPKAFLQGTNVLDDGAVINRGAVNADYMAAISQSWTAALTVRAAGRAVPQALLAHGRFQYRALRATTFPEAAYPDAPAPRGPVYQPDGVIYDPGGASWGTARRGLWVATDATARVLGLDDEAASPGLAHAGVWLSLHARDQRRLQARFADGHTYSGTVPEDLYRGGREEYNAQQLAVAVWARAVSRATPFVLDRSPLSGLTPR